jgi:protein-tyrosine phosphatase
MGTIYWITGSGPLHLAIMSCPGGGALLEPDIRFLQSESVDILVSLLTREEIAHLDLKTEPALCATHGIEFRSFPITDHSIPASYQDVAGFAIKLEREMRAGKAIAIHCFAGIGRSSLMAACVLAVHGMPLERAFNQIRDARGCNVPETQAQREWVESFAQRLVQGAR